MSADLRAEIEALRDRAVQTKPDVDAVAERFPDQENAYRWGWDEGADAVLALLAAHPVQDEARAAGAVAARIGSHGPCSRRDRHDPHIETSGIVDNGGNIVLDECPGQSADCPNCDDRKCMACVNREIHDVCRNDCPDCCCPDCGVCKAGGNLAKVRVDAILVAVFDNLSKGEL